MKQFVTFLFIILLFGCSSLNRIPVQTTYNYIDSTIVNVIDSTVIIPIERIIDIVPQYDTLILETSTAKSISYIDTTLHILRGNIENKNNIQYKYKYKDRIEYRDSIVTKEVSVEVPVVEYKHYWYEKYLIIISIICFFLCIVFCLIIFKK